MMVQDCNIPYVYLTFSFYPLHHAHCCYTRSSLLGLALLSFLSVVLASQVYPVPHTFRSLAQPWSSCISSLLSSPLFVSLFLCLREIYFNASLIANFIDVPNVPVLYAIACASYLYVSSMDILPRIQLRITSS